MFGSQSVAQCAQKSDIYPTFQCIFPAQRALVTRRQHSSLWLCLLPWLSLTAVGENCWIMQQSQVPSDVGYMTALKMNRLKAAMFNITRDGKERTAVHWGCAECCFLFFLHSSSFKRLASYFMTPSPPKTVKIKNP